MQETDELALIEGCIQQEAFAQEQLYKKYYNLLLKICARYVANMTDAETLLNDSFLKIFSSLQGFRHQGSFEGWLKRVTVNTCLDYVRSKEFQRGRSMVEIQDFHGEGMEHPEKQVLQQFEFNRLVNYIQQLPDTMRTVFSLYVFDDFSHKEIAAQLGFTENTSQWYLHQARKELRQKITLHQQQEAIA
jgi:RNA polymerase sigma factor (sigma-70 family)